MGKLVLTPQASRDIDEITDYINQYNPRAAKKIYLKLEATSKLLAENPLIGTKKQNIAPFLRFFPVGNYLILYFPLDNGVEIVRYIHGKRNLRGVTL